MLNSLSNKIVVKIKLLFTHVLKQKDKYNLGRWNITYDTKKIDRKVDLANEDHCGPCGMYISKKKNIKNTNI